jgi:hypothetical protein
VTWLKEGISANGFCSQFMTTKLKSKGKVYRTNPHKEEKLKESTKREVLGVNSRTSSDKFKPV